MGEEDLRVGGARNAGGQRQHALCPAGTVKWHENSLVALVRRLSLDRDEQNGTGRVGQDFLSGAANPALAQLLPSAPSQHDQAIAPFADEATNLLCRLSFGERSEEHTSELQSLMRISYAVFCLKKKKIKPYIKLTHNVYC